MNCSYVLLKFVATSWNGTSSRRGPRPTLRGTQALSGFEAGNNFRVARYTGTKRFLIV